MFAAVLGALSIAVILLLWMPGVALAALCLSLAPVRLARGVRWMALAVGGLGLSAGAPLAAWEIQHRLDVMAGRLAANGWRLSLPERVQAATLNLAMGLGGYAVGYPEVASETLWMFVPGSPVREWRSDFAMESPLVRQHVRELLEEARRQGSAGAPVRLSRRRVVWTKRNLERDSLRVALALNSPLYLEAVAYPQGKGWRLELQGRATVRYPSRNRVPLGQLFGRPIVIEEGLFAALQDAGWLHPYEAVWSWTVEDGDPSSLGWGVIAAGALQMSAMDGLAIFWGLGTLYAFVSRRLAVRTGRNSVAWPVWGFFAGPLVLPILLLLKPEVGRPRMIRPWLLITIGTILTGGGAVGATWLFLKALDPRPERVVATAHVNGAEVPTEPDGPTAFAIAMLAAGAAVVAGVSVGGLTGLMITPPIAFCIEVASSRMRCRWRRSSREA